MPLDASHSDLQAGFHAALWQDDPPEGLALADHHDVARRFAVYRNNVHHGLTRALAARFPAIEALVGAEFFTAMARVFIGVSPPSNPVLLGWGTAFPGFLDRFEPVSRLPWLSDVARLELARGHAYHAADATPVQPEVLAVSDLENLRLRLHPSVQLYTSAHPAVQIWQAHQQSPVRKSFETGPDHALIGRQPDFAVVVAPVDPGTHAVLSALVSGASLGQAAANADPTAALTLLLRHGLIINATTGLTS